MGVLKPMALLDNCSKVWARAVSDITNRPAKNTIWSVIQRIVFNAAIYFIWQERNVRRFSQKDRAIDILFSMVVDTVRFKLMGLSF